jgi:hypothetical protein
MTLGRYRKAVAALLTSAVGVAALFWPPVRDVLTAEAITVISGLAATVMVYALPNDDE